MKKELSETSFIDEILKDYPNISSKKEIRRYLSEYPIVKGKRKIHANCDATIVTNNGKEYPYMLNSFTRNEEKLKDFDYISVTRYKSLKEILEEIGLNLPQSKVKISEGNGWYSTGIRYQYKDFYCDL